MKATIASILEQFDNNIMEIDDQLISNVVFPSDTSNAVKASIIGAFHAEGWEIHRRDCEEEGLTFLALSKLIS